MAEDTSAEDGPAEDGRAKILVVEDEWLIAEFLGDVLQGMGYRVLGPVPDVEQALAAVSRDKPDAAILDISLGGGNSLAIADELMRREVPFVFASGYTPKDLPARYSHCVVLSKPISESDLQTKFCGLIKRPVDGGDRT